MATLHLKCPICNKDAKIQSQFELGGQINLVYQCGHLEIKDKIKFQSDTSNALNEALKAPAIVETIDKDNIDSYFADLIEHKKDLAVPGLPIAPSVFTEITGLTSELKEYIKNLKITKTLDFIEQDLKQNPAVGIVSTPAPAPAIHESFFSLDRTKCAFPFQMEGVAFAESTQLKCLIADEMGLGKTIQALVSMKRCQIWPALIIVKGATTFQWAREFQSWVSGVFGSVMPITSRDNIMPGFKAYIISMDLLGRAGVVDLLAPLGIKLVVIDEIQSFKDDSSKRTKALIKLIQDNRIEYRLALSGTPFKNRADEYFTVLNLLDPVNFYSREAFRKRWLVQNDKGAYTRLNPIYLDDFKRLTSKYIIRREKKDVLTDLPALTRDYQLIEIEDQALKNSYNNALDLFKNFMNSADERITSTKILGWLAKLRAITGQAKVQNAIEWAEDFLESTDESLAIGIHHHSVRDTLFNVFQAKKLNPLKLSGEDNVYAKDRISQAFNRGDNRLLVIQALAGGVGLNLQSCANALVLEREWSSADEEQFEARFHRHGQKRGVTITYMIAKGTIDEWFHNMVQEKRDILSEIGFGSSEGEEGSLGFLKDLAETVLANRL